MQAIDSAVILRTLLPVYRRTWETGYRTHGRVERVFRWAIAHKLFTGENPGAFKLIKDALPARPKAKHHAALAYQQVPQLMADLRERNSVSSLALQFAILTASRTSEVTGATWSEIDLDAATWSVPGSRMKGGKAHRVPLSDRAVEILRSLPRTSDFVFVNGGNLPLSNAAMSEMLKGVRPGVTVHGTARSSFSDWARDHTAFSRDVIEMALAHSIRDKTEAAYRRGDALDKRRRLMAEWSCYCEAPMVTGGTIHKIGQRA